jgi:putative peptide zinc metalloprotease protein
MPSPLLSTVWYRVAHLKPKLRSHARLHRHSYRGQVWYLLEDRASGRTHRFTLAARVVISLMDGERSVAQIWDAANRHLADAAPTQGELIELMGQLYAADLLQTDVTPDVAELFARAEREERTRQRQSFSNPMAIRIRLWDPDTFLNRIAPFLRLIWSRWGALLWLVVVLPTLFLLPPHWAELSNDFSDRLLAADNLFVLYLAFPLLKAAHEMGHATAVKANGGEVHDLGVIMLVLLPLPYVEASAATVLRSKYRRAMVDAAGLAVELFIAALAFYLWLLAEPGLFRAVLFNIMTIASVSTLIFNGNPLLRYDAYYILADLAEIPNLAPRAARYWSYIWERYLLGARELLPPAVSRGEAIWLLLYGVASAFYRVIITVFIALFIAGRFFFVGVVMAAWAVAAMALLPLLRGIWHVIQSPELQQNRLHAVATSLGLTAALVGILLFIPLPSGTNTEGVVWLPEEALVRADTNGILTQILVPSGSTVKQGEALLRNESPELAANLQLSQARVQELQAAYNAELVVDPDRAQLTKENLALNAARLVSLRQRAEELVVRARIDGRLIVPQIADLPGHYVHKGDLLAYVVGATPPLVRVVVPQDAIDRVRIAADTVQVRLADRPDMTLTGRVVRALPDGDTFLPSRALSTEGGGQIATDPRETKGAKALQRIFQFDVELDPTAPFTYYGQRVHVRFEHPKEALAVQWYRAIRLLFLSRFNV